MYIPFYLCVMGFMCCIYDAPNRNMSKEKKITNKLLFVYIPFALF